jgi:hypothetical protein
MYLDIQNELMSKAAIAAVAVVSADTFDIGAVNVDPSIGELMAGKFVVTTGAAGAPIATSYLFEVITSAAANLSSPTVIASSGAVLTASARLAVDREVIVPIPQGSITQRYLGFRVTATGGTTPTMSVSAYYVPLKEIPAYKPFPKAYTTI